MISLIKELFLSLVDKEKDILSLFSAAFNFTLFYAVFYLLFGFYSSFFLHIGFFIYYGLAMILIIKGKISKNHAVRYFFIPYFIHLFFFCAIMYYYSAAISAWGVSILWMAILVWGAKNLHYWYGSSILLLLITPMLSGYVVPLIERFDRPTPWITDYISEILNLGVITFVALALKYFSELKDKYYRELALKKEKLETSQKEILEYQKLKDKFFANLSHELRTPLNTISIIADLINSNENENAENEKLNKLIEQTSLHLNVLVNDILDFSKARDSSLNLKKESFDLKETLESTMNMLQLRFYAKDLESRLQFIGSLPEKVVGDRQRLIQIFTNIIGNSFKFTQEGSIQVDCQAKNQNENACTLVVTVKDTGIGMSTEELTHIFQPYYQVQNSNQNTGAGLGLSIAKSLIDLHGGTIHCQSEKGKGTTFTFSLKFELDNESGLVEVNSEKDFLEWKNKLNKTLKILVVDDHQTNLILLNKLLSVQLGDKVEVQGVGDGESCLELLQKESFDLIFMDIQMPIRDGFETTQVIRNNLNIPSSLLPVVALTATMDSKENMEKCLNAGMNDFLGKPFKKERLQATLIKNIRLD